MHLIWIGFSLIDSLQKNTNHIYFGASFYVLLCPSGLALFSMFIFLI